MSETIYFQQGNILITNTRFVVGAHTYPIVNISSVSLVRDLGPGSIKIAVLLFLGFIIGGYCLFTYGPTTALSVGIFTMLGAFLIGLFSKEHQVVVTNAAGQQPAISGISKDLGQQITTAINNSIIARG